MKKPYTPFLFHVKRTRPNKPISVIERKVTATLRSAHQARIAFPSGHPVREYILKPRPPTKPKK